MASWKYILPRMTGGLSGMRNQLRPGLSIFDRSAGCSCGRFGVGRRGAVVGLGGGGFPREERRRLRRPGADLVLGLTRRFALGAALVRAVLWPIVVNLVCGGLLLGACYRFTTRTSPSTMLNISVGRVTSPFSSPNIAEVPRRRPRPRRQVPLLEDLRRRQPRHDAHAFGFQPLLGGVAARR